jgi:hypothetical protein
MTERTAVPERVGRRAKTARRGGGSGSQAVGDYVGQPASEAAQAVRRAGLRPGLDRSFGCPAELIGLVVAQEPMAGSDLARNGMVTLYVAAPGDEPRGGDADTAATASGESDEKQAASEPIKDPPSPLTAMPVRARRRRKPGHAHRSAALVETPPPPAPAVEATPPAYSPALPAVEPPAESPVVPDGALDKDELADELGEREFPHEDFVVHVEDVLAGRSGPPWRRAYPRRRARHRLGSNGRLRAWLGEHRLLAGAVAVALVLWTVVGVASTGHHERTSSVNAVAPGHAPSTRRPGPALPAAAQRLNAHKTTARSPRLHHTRREWHAARPRRIPRPAPGPARPAAPAVRATVATPPREAPAPQPSEAPPAAPPEQRGGGLFSP